VRVLACLQLSLRESRVCSERLPFISQRRKLVNGEDPLTRDFPDPLYEEFEESSSEFFL